MYLYSMALASASINNSYYANNKVGLPWEQCMVFLNYHLQWCSETGPIPSSPFTLLRFQFGMHSNSLKPETELKPWPSHLVIFIRQCPQSFSWLQPGLKIGHSFQGSWGDDISTILTALSVIQCRIRSLEHCLIPGKVFLSFSWISKCESRFGYGLKVWVTVWAWS